MGKRSIGVMAVGLAGAMVLGACGSDAKALSKAEYIAKGDALCKSFDGQADPAFEKMFEEFPEVDMAVAKSEMPKIAEAADKFVADFKALEGPEADAATIGEIEKGLDKADSIFATAAGHAKAGDEEKFKATLFSSFEEFDKLDEKSRNYGFKVCGEEDEDGEGEGDEKGPATPLTPEQQAFVTEADAVCKEAEDIVDPSLGPIFSGNLPEAAKALNDVIIPAGREELAKLRALTPPKGDEAKVKSLLDSIEAGLPNLDATAAAAAAGDKAGFDAALKKVIAGFEETEGPFREYGFKDCGD